MATTFFLLATFIFLSCLSKIQSQKSAKTKCQIIVESILGSSNQETIVFKPYHQFEQQGCFQFPTMTTVNTEEGFVENQKFLAFQPCSQNITSFEESDSDESLSYLRWRKSSQLLLLLMCKDMREIISLLRLNQPKPMIDGGLVRGSSDKWFVYLDSTEEFEQFQKITSRDSNILENFLVSTVLVLIVNINTNFNTSADEVGDVRVENHFEFYRVFRPTKNCKNPVFERLIFTDDESFDFLINIGEHRFSNLHKNYLEVTGVKNDRYDFDTNITTDSLDGTSKFGDSFTYHILSALEFTMNFTTKIKVATSWGSFDDSNNEWIGMIADLLNGSDLSISSAADVPFRRVAVDFNMPTNLLRLSAFFKKTRSSTDAFALVEPFKRDFWLALLLWLIALSLSLIGFKVVLTRIERRKPPKANSKAATSESKLDDLHHIDLCGYSPSLKARRRSKDKQENKMKRNDIFRIESNKGAEKIQGASHPYPQQFKFKYPSRIDHLKGSDSESSSLASSLPKQIQEEGFYRRREDSVVLWDDLDCVQWAIGSVTLQGFVKIPKYTCYRIIVGTGCLSGVVFYAAYAGTLISFLSVSFEAITNFGQLLSTTYTISVVDSPVSTRFLKESPQETDQEIYRRRRLSPLYGGMEDAKEELIKGSFVFLTDHINAYDTLKNEMSPQDSCAIKELTVDNAVQRQGTMVPKRSPFKRIIDYQILRMREFGLVDRWTAKYLPTRATCNDLRVFEGVEIISVIFAFGALGLGAVVSLFILALEKTVPVYCQ